MIEITLTQNKKTVIDEVDADLAEQVKWFAHRRRDGPNQRWYALGNTRIKGKRRSILLHRLIMERILGRFLKTGEHVDHINHDGLDNRRQNLRIANTQENNYNSRKGTNGKTSIYKGVFWHKQHKKWYAHIRKDKKSHFLGLYRNELDAAKAYDKAAKDMYGKFACLNLPEDESEAANASISERTMVLTPKEVKEVVIGLNRIAELHEILEEEKLFKLSKLATIGIEQIENAMGGLDKLNEMALWLEK